MKKQILLLCLALISLCGYAQNITVKGVVTSAADKEPMIGLTALIKGTTNGTVTDLDGNYTLNNVPARRSQQGLRRQEAQSRALR